MKSLVGLKGWVKLIQPYPVSIPFGRFHAWRGILIGTSPRTCEQNKQMEALGSPTEPKHLPSPVTLLL